MEKRKGAVVLRLEACKATQIRSELAEALGSGRSRRLPTICLEAMTPKQRRSPGADGE